jgi:hypothetical protein
MWLYFRSQFLKPPVHKPAGSQNLLSVAQKMLSPELVPPVAFLTIPVIEWLRGSEDARLDREHNC